MQEDVRLAIFQAFLNEDWPVSTVLCFLRARSLLGQPAPTVFIQYPMKESGKSDVPCWICLAKALWIAEVLLGPRTLGLSDRFHELLQRCAIQV